jgi:hypothetical protein
MGKKALTKGESRDPDNQAKGADENLNEMEPVDQGPKIKVRNPIYVRVITD